MDNTGKTELNYCYNCMKHLDSGQTVCPFCGHDNSVSQNPKNALPEGAILAGKFLIGSVLGQGGFGITYLGLDLALQVIVAIKEYFPVGVGTRASQSIRVVSIDARSGADGFQKGCDEFQSEAQILARFNSPNIVHVRDYFRENGTAYIVMDYVNGNSLKQELEACGGKIPWERVTELFKPLILELDQLHKNKLIHRDIKPDNLKITRDEDGEERLVLLDFGAARSFVSAQVTKTYTAMVTHGYAPVEQYSPKSRQGPYTDVYALCATMYHVIAGEIPPTSTDRMTGEADIHSFASLGLDVSETVENALRHGLEVRGVDRPQTMKDFYDELTGQVVPKSAINNAPQVNPVTETKVDPPVDVPPVSGESTDTDKKRKKSNLLVIPILLVLFFGGCYMAYRSLHQNRQDTSATQTVVSMAETFIANERETQTAVSALNTETAQKALMESSTQDAIDALNTQSALDLENEQAANIQATVDAENTLSAQYRLETEQVRQTQAVNDAVNTLTAQMRQTEQAQQTQNAADALNTLSVQAKETEQAQQTQAAIDVMNTRSVQAKETEQAQKTQTAIDVMNTISVQTRKTEQARQTEAMIDAMATISVQLQGTEQAQQTQSAIDVMNTLAAQAKETERAQQTQSAIDVMNTLTAQAKETEQAQQTQSAIDVLNTQTAQARAAEQTMKTEAAIEKQFHDGQTATAWAEAREAESRMTETQSAVYAIQTQNALQNETAQAVQIETQAAQATKDALYAEQTATSWLATQNAMMLQTQTKSAQDVRDTQTVIEQLTETAAAWERTQELIALAQTQFAETQSAFYAQQTEVYMTQQAVDLQKTAQSQTQQVFYATQTRAAEATSTFTPLPPTLTPTATKTPVPVLILPTQTMTPVPPTATPTATLTPTLKVTSTPMTLRVVTYNGIVNQPNDVGVLMRDVPSRYGNVIRSVLNGNTVTISGERRSSQGEFWAKIRTKEGQQGWIQESGIVISADITAGGRFTFGSYEQNNNFLDDSEAIEWQVLEVRDGRILVISSLGLDEKAFDNDSGVDWVTSSLREWLNEDFFNGAFNIFERERIVPVSADDPTGEGFDTDQTGETDRVFLLNSADVNKYFGTATAERRCRLTDYAKANSSSGNNEEAGVLNWWKPVLSAGSNADVLTVRPAFWMDISDLVSSDNLMLVTPTADPDLTLTPIYIPGPVRSSGGNSGGGNSDDEEVWRGDDNSSSDSNPSPDSGPMDSNVCYTTCDDSGCHEVCG